MEQPCMRAYSLLLIKTCHRRGIFAMGGMSAQIPVKNNPQANEAALQKVFLCSRGFLCSGQMRQFIPLLGEESVMAGGEGERGSSRDPSPMHMQFCLRILLDLPLPCYATSAHFLR